MVSIITSTRPASTSVSGEVPPLNGMWFISMPACELSHSPSRWWLVPMPAEE
jgi:hypothetical protein